MATRFHSAYHAECDDELFPAETRDDAPQHWCADCRDVEVLAEGETCRDCAAPTCDQCDGDGYIITCRQDGAHEQHWPCTCAAGDDWREARQRDEDRAEYCRAKAAGEDV